MKPLSLITARIATTMLAASWCLGTSTYADVPEGDGKWTAQTWASDPNHGNESLKGFYYWPKNPPRLAGKRALILVLHGCEQTALGDVIPDTHDDGFNWSATAEKYGAVIAAPNATDNVAGLHCWEYFGTGHTRTSGHVGVLLDVVKRFKDDSRFVIDPDQVYVAGLSSGGGEVMVLGCVAPDIFAGLGNNAGPSLGTGAFQIGSVPFGYDASTAARNCRAIAPSNNPFATQIFSAIYGSSDRLVATDYANLNAEAMRLIYGGSFTRGPDFTVEGAGGGNGSGRQWAD